MSTEISNTRVNTSFTYTDSVSGIVISGSAEVRKNQYITNISAQANDNNVYIANIYGNRPYNVETTEELQPLKYNIGDCLPENFARIAPLLEPMVESILSELVALQD